ncbi:NYN domain-containing protein [Candidatus Saccharibacteria bacterium]|nr:NYN domain-containing protein [Candidatus Saccharibacteria bacterium]
MRNIVYIDGQNFLYKASEILVKYSLITDKQDLYALDIRPMLEKLFPNEELEIRFFGVVKIKHRPDLGQEILNKSIRFSDNLRRVRSSLTKQNITYIEAGKLKIRDSDICKICGNKDYKYQEKGVDVGIAVSIVENALRDEVDRIILVSSDTDLIPAILCAKKAGKNVTYVGFSERLTRALVDECDVTQVLRDDEIVDAYKVANGY